MLFFIINFYNFGFYMPKLIILRCAYINRISFWLSRIFSFSRRTCTLFIIVFDSIILEGLFFLSKLLFFF